jgi:hypothetical protein
MKTILVAAVTVAALSGAARAAPDREEQCLGDLLINCTKQVSLEGDRALGEVASSADSRSSDDANRDLGMNRAAVNRQRDVGDADASDDAGDDVGKACD